MTVLWSLRDDFGGKIWYLNVIHIRTVTKNFYFFQVDITEQYESLQELF